MKYPTIGVHWSFILAIIYIYKKRGFGKLIGLTLVARRRKVAKGGRSEEGEARMHTLKNIVG